MKGLYPPIEPYDHFQLDVGNGNAVFVEQCGNPDGHPALVLHGGPGSGCTPSMRRFFDPSCYRVVLFDQRGCGRSSPLASEPDADLSSNTTIHLLSDIEVIRKALGIEHLLVYGHSWGSLLGLAYTVEHPAVVSEAVLAGVTTGDPREIEWLYRDLGALRPDAYRCLLDGAPGTTDDNVIGGYAAALFDGDPEVRARAAYAFSKWDWSSAFSADPGPMNGRWADGAFQLARSRIVTHYFRHNCWLDSEVLLEGASTLGHIPAVLVDGELDLQTPTRSAERLASSWPGSELVVVAKAGHSTSEPGMEAAIVRATDRFAARR